MTTKDLQDKIIAIMKRWQKIEDLSSESSGKIISKTENPVLRLIMEIIQRDSQMHHRLQGLVIDTLEHKPVTLTPDEMGKVWDLIEDHIEIEKQTLELANMAVEALSGKKLVVQEYVLNYLKKDEEKHEKMLQDLNTIKKGMYPY
jgi:hypothetical protein